MAEFTVVIPTLNERSNIEPLLAHMEKALRGISWEVIFVDDDSSDGTAALARRISLSDPRVRIVHRIGRRGLSSAAIEGMLASAAPYIAVMDGDLQHDENLLPTMLQKLRQENLDIVIASRHKDGGSVGRFSKARVLLSNVGKRLSRTVCRCDLTDPMSGYFVLSRSFFDEVVRRLSGVGFKILVDILASSRRQVRLAEVPYTFRSRLSGESKLDTAVAVEYVLLLADKLVGNVIPVRFALFVLVGFVGLLVHLTVLGALHTVLPFLQAHACATATAMVSNFLLNNLITYRDRRLRGSAMLKGFLSFCAACSAGALINFGLAQLLVSARLPWYLAGFGGMVVSSVWNFGVTAIFTWRQKRHATMFGRSREGTALLPIGAVERN